MNFIYHEFIVEYHNHGYSVKHGYSLFYFGKIRWVILKLIKIQYIFIYFTLTCNLIFLKIIKSLSGYLAIPKP